MTTIGTHEEVFTYDTTSGSLHVLKNSPSTFTVAGINANGRVVGSLYKRNNSSFGFDAQHSNFTVLTDTDAMAASTFGWAVNDLGDVAGEAFVGTTSVAFLFKNGAYTSFGFQGAYVAPLFVDNDGTVDGTYTTGRFRAAGFVMSSGVTTTYMVPGSRSTEVLGLGPGGSVLGAYTFDRNKYLHYSGFVYANGRYYPVNFPGATDTYVNAVNAAGSMVGYYVSEKGSRIFIAKCLPSQQPCTQ